MRWRILYKVLITGASSGIGRVTALRLARRGYQVIATGRSEGRLRGLVEEAGALRLELKTFSMDLRSSRKRCCRVRVVLDPNLSGLPVGEDFLVRALHCPRFPSCRQHG